MNIENLLNAITAYIELEKLLPMLEKAVEEKDLEISLKLVKNWKEFEMNLIPEFEEDQAQKLKSLIE
jgi:hypothetical protein